MKTVIRLLALAVVLALAAIGIATAAADGWQTEFSASGRIAYALDNGDPNLPTTSTATFETEGGEITRVTIDAENQVVMGLLTQITTCQEGRCGHTYNTRFVSVTGYHVELDAVVIETRPYTQPAPGGDVTVEAEIIHGALTASLDAEFVSGNTSGDIDLIATGWGQFACFAPAPGPLSECMGDGPGKLLPVGLDVIATGPFALDITGVAPGGAHVFRSGDLTIDLYAMADLSKVARQDPRSVTASGVLTVENVIETTE